MDRQSFDNGADDGVSDVRQAKATQPPDLEGMARIAGGVFLMGSDRHYAEEAPVHKVVVHDFWMDRFAVTNAEYRRFVEATRYVTLAERPINAADYPGADPGRLQPASVVFKKAPPGTALSDHFQWWVYIPGADWRRPRRPSSTIKGSKIISSCTSLSKTLRPTRTGGAKLCRRRPNGSSPRVVAWMARNMFGATSSRPRAATWPISGRRVSLAEPLRGRVRMDRAGQFLSAERLRAL